MKSIVVVDDDDSYVYLVQRQIRSLNPSAKLISCASGQEALDYLDSLEPGESIPDIMILDLNMPVMNGFEFLESFERRCKERHHSTPPPAIWIVTSSDIDSDKKKALEFTSARGYLVKPIGKKIIEELLKDSA